MAKNRAPLKLLLMQQGFRGLGLLVPSLAARLAYRQWSATRRFRESEHDRRWRVQARLQMLDHPCGRIAVYHWGQPDRPVVICVHGWNGRASQFASMLPMLLRAGYQVVAFDAPGHGKSQGNSTNIFRISDVLRSVASPYPSIAAVISHSFGGMALAYTSKHLGLAAQKLVMIASPISTHYLIDMYAQSLGLGPRVMRRFDALIRHEFGDDVFEKISAEQNLKNSEIPILLIHDKQDRAVSWRNSERIVETANNAVAIYTEGHGHRRLLRDKKLIRRIIEFINNGGIDS
ncbi:MAG: alpha/beta fold hydrolase [Gammaproteobacteria bacterium]|jgi:pimeloyl-ACP methyl ester carboxylesterase